MFNPFSILSFLFFFFFFRKRGKRDKTQRRAQVGRTLSCDRRRGASPSEGTKIPIYFSPSFTRPAFGIVSELRTDFAIGRSRVETAGSSTTPLVFTTTLRESNRDVVFSPSWNETREWMPMCSSALTHTDRRDERWIPSPAFAEGEKSPSPPFSAFFPHLQSSQNGWLYNFLSNLMSVRSNWESSSLCEEMERRN